MYLVAVLVSRNYFCWIGLCPHALCSTALCGQFLCTWIHLLMWCQRAFLPSCEWFNYTLCTMSSAVLIKQIRFDVLAGTDAKISCISLTQKRIAATELNISVTWPRLLTAYNFDPKVCPLRTLLFLSQCLGSGLPGPATEVHWCKNQVMSQNACAFPRSARPSSEDSEPYIVHSAWTTIASPVHCADTFVLSCGDLTGLALVLVVR